VARPRRGSGRQPAARLNISERLWALPLRPSPAASSSASNIARGFISDLPILLLDEPTASLMPQSRRGGGFDREKNARVLPWWDRPRR